MKKIFGILFWVATAALAIFLIFLIYDQYKPEDMQLFGNSTTAVSFQNYSGETKSGETLYPAPGIELANLEGKTVKLSDYKGRTVFISFWAMEDASCMREMGELNKAAKIFEERGDAVVLTVNKTDTKAAISKYFMENGYELQVLMDTEGQAFYNYGVNSVPVTFVVDAEGYARGYIPSATTASILTGIADEISGIRQ